MAVLTLGLAGCQARPAAPLPQPPATALPVAQVPVHLPEDDHPHSALTEWWYYTGHLGDEQGRRYGFEFVVFQSTRVDKPVLYAAHFAVTDLEAGRFAYGARVQQQAQPPAHLSLEVGGWRLEGEAGRDRLSAEMEDYELELSLEATKPAALHQGGWIDFGPAGGSYYVSRTRMAAVGRLRVAGEWHLVQGQAWFDHQWGDFVTSGASAWDWFGLQLDNGTEVMLVALRGLDGQPLPPFGTVVDPTGRTLDLASDDIDLNPTGAWHSPKTGGQYPSGWTVSVRPLELELRVSPLLQDQELAFPSLTYWEGAVSLSGTQRGRPVDGLGYVELVGYAQ